MLPFPGGIEDTSNGSVIFSVGAALLYLGMVNVGPSLPRSLVKTLAVALLAGLAALQGGPVLLVLALSLSAVGDWFLSRDGEPAFLSGLGSFLAAHLVYVVLFWISGESVWLLFSDPLGFVAAAAMVAAALAMLILLMRAVGPGLRLPIFGYICAILAMGLTAIGLDDPLVIAGAVAFMASDAILAAERFLVPAIAQRRAWMRYAVWSLYYLAQALIVAGFLTRG